MHVSILIVTFKRDDLLARCLETICEKCGGAPQVVVVDNGAGESASAERIVAEYPGAVYVRSEKNLGFAGGNNLGLPFCTGAFVLLLNNDTEIIEDPIPTLLAYMDAHPEVAVVQGRMALSRLGNVLDDCGTYLTPFGVQLHNYLLQPDPGNLVPAAVFAAKGACLMFRREVVQQAGGFLFHGHFGSYYEETDFCHRVWLAGREVHFVPSPSVAHLWGATASMFDNNAIWRQSYRNMLFSFLTLFGTRGLVTVLPGFFVLLAAQVTLKLFTGRFAAAAAPLKALGDIWRDRRLVAAFRREAQGHRAISDKQLFRRILKRPRLSYYYLAATNRIAEYKG